MKKIIAMAAMLLAVVVFAYTYRLQTLAWLQLPAFAVTEKDITDTLKADGTPEEDKEVLSMRACTEDERCTAEQTGTLSAIRKNPSISPTRYLHRRERRSII